MNQLTSARIERNRRHRKIERVLAVSMWLGIAGAILFFTAVIGYVGEQDRQEQSLVIEVKEK